MAAKRARAARGWDLFASGLSVACVVHCLGLPLIAILLPASSQLVDGHLLHIAMVAIAVPVTLWVVSGEVSTGPGRVFAGVALAGLAFLVAALFFSPGMEAVLTVIGALMLGAAHLWRYSRHRSHAMLEESALDDG